MEASFKDKVAVVTGGGFGIGRATAVAFAKAGSKVEIADWVEDDETLNRIRSSWGEANFVKCNVSKTEHVKMLMDKTLAAELARSDIRENAVCPGAIETTIPDRFTGRKKEADKQFENMEPTGRPGEPEEVDRAVLYLCSDDASFVTGHALAVDGGWIVR